MPTNLPRVQVPFDETVYEALKQMAKIRGASLAHVVSELVKTAIELGEDLAFVKVSEARLSSFNRDDAYSTNEILEWNRGRKRKK